MTQHDDVVYFGHMLDAAKEAYDLVSSVDKVHFERDRVLQLAVTHLIEIIGEAARRVSTEGRERLPDVPWSEIIGMRHRIVHDYLGVKIERVWQTATQDLEPIIYMLKSALPDQPPE
jgi:uncharacterized protein with HEPN domain